MIKPATLLTAMFIAFFSFAGDNDLDNLMLNDNNITLDDKKDERDDKHKNRRAGRPIGVNVVGFGPAGMVGASLDGFLTPKFAIEAGAGVQNQEGDINYFLGGRYHLLGGSFLNITPYVGAYTAFHHNGRDLQNHQVYFPFGIHRIKKSGFNWSAEVAYSRSTYTDKNLSGAIKIGYRF